MTPKKVIEKSVILVAILSILLSVLPMGLSPYYNKKIPTYRVQYELMAEAMLNGKITFDYKNAEKLAKIDNPYNIEERKKGGADIEEYWDSAYYNGKFYMYFGVVPTVTLFLPYRFITGHSLNTYHATQIYTALFILGLYFFLYNLRKRFFQKISHKRYLSLCFTFSMISTWYISTAPALYCTAISAGICMEIWSIFFFEKAVYDEKPLNNRLWFAFLGSLFGALAFGARPPIALANFIAIPLFIDFIKREKLNFKLFLKLILAIMPYVIIGLALMYYNYIRFDSPFEFGQSYQITVADQSNYSLLNGLKNNHVLSQMCRNLLGLGRSTMSPFPSIMLEYPVFWIIAVCIFKYKSFSKENKKTSPLFWTCIATCFIIVFAQTISCPYLLERYKSDVLWLICIVCFMAYGYLVNNDFGKGNKILQKILTVCLILCCINCTLLFLYPYDYNFTKYLLKKYR